MEDDHTRRVSARTWLAATVAAWFAYLLIDLLTHGVILAPWWRATEQFWLPPRDLFRMIPVGYTSFAIYCGVLVWLLGRLGPPALRVVDGLRWGALAGLVFGLTFTLACYSVFRLPASALLVWPATTLAASTASIGVAAWVIPAERPWRRVGSVVLMAIVLAVAGIVIQNIFFPTPADHRM